MNHVLIISYYWPPAGGPGVQRILKFAKYLPEFGWIPHILTVENGEFPARDDSLMTDIGNNCIVTRTFNPEPYALYKKFTGKSKTTVIPTSILDRDVHDTWKDQVAKWIRANFFIPDAKNRLETVCRKKRNTNNKGK